MEKYNILEICDVYQPKTVATKEFVPNGQYSVYGANGIIGNYDKYNHENSEVLMACRGATCGAINVSKPYSWINGNAMVIHPKGNIPIKQKYLAYCLQASDKRNIISGTAQPQITRNNMKLFQLPLCEIEEQERIVTRIEELFSELDKAVEILQTTKQQLAVYRQAVYSSVYSGIAELKPITDFFEITGGLTKNSKRSELPIKMPYLRVANVYYNRLDLSEIKNIGVTESEVERTLLEKNDLLFVEGNGSKSQIGRVAIWDGSIEQCLHQNHIIKGRPLGNMLPEYALFYLISGGGRNQITDIAKSTSGLYTLSTNKVKNLQIPVCNITKQQQVINEIASRLSICESIELTVDTVLAQADAMRQSILKQAFEGGYV